MADESSNVTIKVGAKADAASIKTATDKVTRTLDLVLRKAQSIGTDAAKAFSKQVEAIRSGVVSGQIGAKEAETLANQLIRITKSANGTTDVIGQYSGAVRIAAANSQKFTNILTALSAAERAEAQAQREAAKAAAEAAAEASKAKFLDQSAKMRERLGGMGTVGAKAGAQRLAAIEDSVRAGGVSEDELSGLAATIEKLLNGSEGASNTVKKLDAALAATAATSKGASDALEKVGAVYTNIKSGSGDGLDKLRQKLDIDEQAQEFADAIATMAKESEDALPESQAFIDELKEIQKILASGNAIDTKALADMAKHFKAATKEAQGLDSVTSRKLLPNLLKAGEAIKNIKPKGDIAGAAEQVSDAIGSIAPEAQRVSSTIMGWAKSIKGVGSLIAKFPGMFALVGAAIAGAVAIFSKLSKMMQESMEKVARSNAESVADGLANINKRLENQNRIRQRGVDLQSTQIANARAIADAERDIANAQLERNKSLEEAAALSDAERTAIERKYRLEQAQRTRDVAVTEANRAKEDNERTIKNNNDRIAELEKANEAAERKRAQALEMAHEMRQQGDEGVDATAWGERTKNWFAEAFGQKLEGKTADEIAKELEAKAREAREQSSSRSQEIADLKSQNEGLGGKGAIYDKQIEAANAQLEAAKAEEEAAKTMKEREIAAQDRDRKWQLEDREWEEERAAREQMWGRLEARGGASMARKHASDSITVAEGDLSSDLALLKEAEERELARINSTRPFAERVGDLKDVHENELSDDFKRERSRLEGLIVRDRGNLRAAEEQMFRAEMQGDDRRAEMMSQMRGGGNRLTAMGLGGDVGAGQATAKNTRITADKITELTPLVRTLVNNRQGRRLETPGSARWGM